LNDIGKPLTASKRRLLIVIALAAAVLYVGAALITDASKTRQALAELGWYGCVLVLALSAINYVLRYYRWQHFLAALGRVLPAHLHFLYYLSGFAFTVSPAKAGEAFRSIHLREHGVGYSESLAALFAERLLDLVAMCLLASLIAIEHVAYRPLIAGVAIIAVVLLGLARHPYLPRRLQSISESSSRRLLVRPLAVAANLLRSSHRLLQPRSAAFGLAIALVAWGAEGLGLFLICQGLHIMVPASTAIGIYAIASLAGSAAFILPAGIGGMEIVMTTLLIAHDASLSTAVIATLLCRIATLWFAVMIGVAASVIVEFQQTPRPLRSVS
jgi:glycosyltransferase 2 family protein